LDAVVHGGRLSPSAHGLTMHKHINGGKSHQRAFPLGAKALGNPEGTNRPMAKRIVKSRSLDPYSNEAYGIRDRATVTQSDEPSAIQLATLSGEERRAVKTFHRNRLGALRHTRALFKFARATGVTVERARKRLGKATFQEWVQSTLGVPVKEALGWMRFVDEMDGWEVDASSMLEVEPKILLYLIRALSESLFPPSVVWPPGPPSRIHNADRGIVGSRGTT
jgi:hypothetical protein